jgi:hypothetical protein
MCGVGTPTPRRTTEVELPARSTMMAYTDGLVERRDEVIA